LKNNNNHTPKHPLGLHLELVRPLCLFLFALISLPSKALIGLGLNEIQDWIEKLLENQ